MTKRFEPYQSAYAVIVNSDLTEGRGHSVVKAICEKEATAKRIAYKADVQGSNGTVRPIDLFKDTEGHVFSGLGIYGPVTVIHPTKEDEIAQQRLNESRTALQKAKAAGLTDEDIAALRGE